MIRIGLRDAKAHLHRFVMSIIAIALGVAFVIGAFCFRGMLNDQVSQMMATNADADVYVRSTIVSDKHEPNTEVKFSDYESLPVSLLKDVRDVPGVTYAGDAQMLTNIVLVGKNGTAVTTMGPPTMGIGVSKGSWRGAKLTQGHWPEADNQIVLHSGAAEQSGLKVGDTTKVVFPDGPRDMKVVGTFTTDTAQLGAVIVGLDPSLVKHYVEQEGESTDEASRFTVYGNATTPLNEQQQQQLADRINKALPKDSHAIAVTGDSLRNETTKTTQDALGFIQPLILIFAAIALFVGSFIIANTFTMIVRESMRGYALLRSIGASPAQVFMTVVVQAIVLGLIGSVIGVFLGWGMLELIAKGMGSMGMPLSGSPVPSVADIIIGVLVGIVVTLIGASLPARRAALAPPIQAMNETVNPEKPVRRRGVIGLIMIVLGALAWWFAYALATTGTKDTAFSAFDGLHAGWPLGVGAGLVVIGVIVIGPAIVTPVSKVLGWIPEHMFSVTGRLATRNIARSKRRTANTAAALFVGLAIVSCIGVVASSVKVSLHDLVDNNLNANYVLKSASMTTSLPKKAIEEVKQLDDVDKSARLETLMGVKYDNKMVMPMTTSADLFESISRIRDSQGDPVQAFKQGEAIVGKTMAEDHEWKLGQTITLKAENVVVDEQATAQAQQQYMADVQARVQAAQQKAQQLAAAGDLAGAQAQGQEAQKIMEDAQHVDPATLVRTTKKVVRENVRIGAIANEALYNDSMFLPASIADKLTPQAMRLTQQMYVLAKPGTDLETLHKQLTDIAKPFYTIAVLDRDQYKSSLSETVNQVLAILYALLALSVVIAIFGIVNTLALNVSERTKEIGLLRAIGTSRGQIRGMLAIEAVIMSVFGTLLGIIVGVGAGFVIRAVFSNQGMTTLSIPWATLLLFLALSIVVGLLSSVSPASRALKQPVLDAVKSE
ncbi:ABC transporter permease [Bifidobacterium dolichotidis]|uniref:ABC transporter permease n=1 Tax=Bifidobacterium dolichotidis TaxID=2306976 RepID=A0A430FS80_9BIFI|nr:ABC transporter permease [Bifidobacterium dolichotidis]RSX55734.1 ABC transporter permease [Bifidobacterium dolichotidis]